MILEDIYLSRLRHNVSTFFFYVRVIFFFSYNAVHSGLYLYTVYLKPGCNSRVFLCGSESIVFILMQIRKRIRINHFYFDADLVKDSDSSFSYWWEPRKGYGSTIIIFRRIWKWIWINHFYFNANPEKDLDPPFWFWCKSRKGSGSSNFSLMQFRKRIRIIHFYFDENP